jgi:large subunit ribosomal protein L4
MASIIGNLGLNGQRTLFVLAEADKNISLSVRNMPRSESARAADLNTYDIMKAEKIVVAMSAIEKISQTLGAKN